MLNFMADRVEAGSLAYNSRQAEEDRDEMKDGAKLQKKGQRLPRVEPYPSRLSGTAALDSAVSSW